MTLTGEESFWLRLAKCANQSLRADPDRSIHFLWVDDILPPEAVLPDVGRTTLETRAWLSEDSGRSQLLWRVDLILNEAAMVAFRANDWDRLLSGLDQSDWLGIDRATKQLEIVLRL